MTRGLGIVGAAFVVALALAPISAEAAPKTSTALAGADFECVGGQIIIPDAAFNFKSTGVSFGSAISFVGSSFNSILLQQGIYQIHLSGARFAQPAVANTFPSIVALLNNAAATTASSWSTTVGIDLAKVDIVGGDRLVSVTTPNTSLQFTNFAVASVTSGSCHLVITKLQ